MKPWFVFALLLSYFIAPAQQTVLAEKYSTGNGSYVITYYADNIIRLSYLPAGYDKGENLSDAVILRPRSAHPKALRVNVNGGIISFNGKALMINADTMSGVYGFNFALETGEQIFGGGERALPLNRRGYRFNLYNNPWYGYTEGADNLNYSVPFFTSSKGYGLFFDNPSSGFADIGKSDANVLQVGFSAGELNVYVILGKDYKEILESYHRLTGKQPLPPRWAFGNLMSRFGYTSEAQVNTILSRMQQQHIPVDAIIFDLFWFGDSIKGTLGNLEWMNRKKWPEPGKMISGFKKQGIQTILVTEPFFVETSKNYTASRPYLAVDSTGKPYYLTDFYFGKGGLIDIFRSDACDWFWKFYKKQMDLGVEAWWGDLGEPEKHPADLFHNLRDYGHRRLFAAGEVHNIYGHNWTKMLYRKYASDFPSKRLFSLNRSGFAGSQRYGIFPWTGDVSRSWSGFRAQLPVLLGMTMSGVPYVHSDAGGFAGGEGDGELYVRWLQFAAFTPVFRPHGTALYEVEPAAASFPSEAALLDTPWSTCAKEAIKMRYAFQPYNYSLAYEQSLYGKPLMSPLYYYYPADTASFTATDEFMWGENVLVAPVLQKSATTRRFYLPSGKWYNMIAQQIVEGGRWYEQPVSLNEFPLLVKAGSFLPMDLKQSQTNLSRYRSDSLSVYYVPSDLPSVYRWYDDDGKSKNAIEAHRYEVITFSSSGKNNGKLKLSIRSNGGSFPGKPARRVLSFGFADDHLPARVMVNGVQKKVYTNEDGRAFYFDIVFTGRPVSIDISW
ncbi:MAG TPA: TIM-barrel domain-containing protein [Chitinophagaceae bacterium]